MSNEAGSHLFLPSANEIPFGKTMSTRSMRSIQEEEPVLDPVGRSPSTTVPTPDAEYFGSPNDGGFGPSFSYVAEQGRLAKGSDTEEEEEELAWAKHTSIVTDYGEDVWVKPSPRLGLQLTPPEAMRGSRRNSGYKLARGDSDEELEDGVIDPMAFAKCSSLLTDGGEDARWGAFLTDDPLATSASRVRSRARIESLRAQSAAEDMRFAPFNMRSNPPEELPELPFGKHTSIVTDFGDEEDLVGKMPSLITKTVTKFLQERGSISGLEAAAVANAAAAANAGATGMSGYSNFQPPRDSVLEAPPSTHAPTAPPGALQPQARSARTAEPAFLPLGEENPAPPFSNMQPPRLSPPPVATNSLPPGTGGFSPGGLLNLAQGQAGVPPLYGGQGGSSSPTNAALQAQAAQMAHERLLMADASERFSQVGLDAGLSQLPAPSFGVDPRLASLMATQSAFPASNLPPSLGAALSMGPAMGPGSMPPNDLEAMLTENLLKQRHHLQQLQLHRVQQQQMQLHHLMQAQQPLQQHQLGMQQQLLQPVMQSNMPVGMQQMPQMQPQAARGGRQDRDQRDTRGKEKSSPSKRQKEKQTTVMLRNLPAGYSRDMLVLLMNRYGFEACFDFVYIPINFRTQAMFGYAFVNFVDEPQAQRARQVFEGFTDWGVQTDKVCEVSWSDMHQGLLAHVNRYRSSPVMHESVPDEYKPAVYSQGKRVAFPAPTKRIRVPRIRRAPEGGEDGDEGEDDGLDGEI